MRPPLLPPIIEDFHREAARIPGQLALRQESLWAAISPRLDQAIDRLPTKYRDAVLARMLPDCGWEEAARLLRTSERRLRKDTARGMQKVARHLRKRGIQVDAETLGLECARHGCTAAPPEGLTARILSESEAGVRKKPAMDLARRTLRAISWAPWKRRLKIAAATVGLLAVVFVIAGFYVASLWHSGRLMAWFIETSSRREARAIPELKQQAKAWPTDAAHALADAANAHKPEDVFQTTNIWAAHLKFSSEQWKTLKPKRIEPVPKLFQPGGEVVLRNPKAQRSGLAGALGFDFEWGKADLDFGGAHLENVAARFKGNGTFIASLYGWKRSFKVDFNKFSKGQKLAGIEEINLANLIDDRSYMSDALAYEFFRDAGVPAPRTGYAWLTISVTNKWNEKPLGLYLLVENLGGPFAAERFGSKKTPIFKPVTYHLFEDLGAEWSSYDAIYDLKTRATEQQRNRVIDFARLVSHASDEEFAQQSGEFLDLDEFARFLAGLVLLSSYDGFLSDGQNFYVYLDPRTNKFGFIPWDLDHAWGGFYLMATAEERERAIIWHPWTGSNRFLERIMRVEDFRKAYRARLEEFLEMLFVPVRLSQRIDEIARVIRSPIAAESSFRLQKFDIAVSDRWVPQSGRKDEMGPNRPVHQLKHFIEARSKSVRQQLDGKSKGVMLGR